MNLKVEFGDFLGIGSISAASLVGILFDTRDIAGLGGVGGDVAGSCLVSGGGGLVGSGRGGGSTNGGVRSLGGNAAVVILVAGHVDVAVNSPVSSPAVLHEPVILAAHGTIANDQHAMVEASARAFRFVVYAGLVQLEGILTGVDGNRDGLLDRGNLESVFISGRNVNVVSHGGTDVGGVELAASLLCLVGVAGLSVNTTVGDDVLEGIIHLTPVATFVAIGAGAVHQILFGERDQVSGAKLMDALQRSGCREGPTTSALALIFDASDGALVSPVNRGGQGSGGEASCGRNAGTGARAQVD